MTCPVCANPTSSDLCSRCGFRVAPPPRRRPDRADVHDATVTRSGAVPTASATDEAAPPPPSTSAGLLPPPSAVPAFAEVSPVSHRHRTALAHVVLWGGTLATTLAFVFVLGLLPSSTPDVVGALVVGLLQVAPFGVAVVLAAREPHLRVVGAVGAVAVLVAATAVAAAGFDVERTWWLQAGSLPLALVTWITVRCHARAGYALAAVAALVGVGWFGPFALSDAARSLPQRLGLSNSTAFLVWGLLPLAVVGLLGLIASLLRPSPPPGRPAVSWSAVAPVAAVLLALVPFVVVDGNPGSDVPAPAADADYAGAGAPTDSGYTGPTASSATAVATSFLDSAVSGGSSPYACDPSIGTPSLRDYTIGQVFEVTTGTFDVSATVTFDDGRTSVVTVRIGGPQVESGGCVESVTETGSTGGGGAVAAGGFPVPSLPAAGDPVPSGGTVPEGTVTGGVVPYTDTMSNPTQESQLVAATPTGMSADETAAVAALIRFLTQINRQDFQAAWQASTWATTAPTANAAFAAGYTTSRHYEVSFGSPRMLTPTLVAVPATFVSRQDPAAQGNPPGVTGCTFWPQYVFLAARVNGTWLDDSASRFTDDPAVAPLKRADPSRPGRVVLNPLSQRVAC